jgi:hypothetical protein
LEIANRYNRHLKYLFGLYPEIEFNYIGVEMSEYFKDKFTKEFEGIIFRYYSSIEKLPTNMRDKYNKYLKNINDIFKISYIAAARNGPDFGEYGGIWFNRDYVNDYKEFMLNVNLSCFDHYSPIGTECVESILTHEFGHLLQEITLKSNDNFIKEKWNVLKKLQKDNFKEYLTDNISSYAGKNSNELFAEAVTEYVHSKKPREISKYMWNNLNLNIQSLRTLKNA